MLRCWLLPHIAAARITGLIGVSGVAGRTFNSRDFWILSNYSARRPVPSLAGRRLEPAPAKAGDEGR